MTPVNANQGEYKPSLGLDSLYIALVTQDTIAGYVADTPEWFAPAAKASQSPVVSQEVQYFDDNPFDVVNAEGETLVELEVSSLPKEMLAKVLGKVFNAASGRLWDNHGQPPDVALSFRSMKSNGKYLYYQYLKGRFSVPGLEATTRAASADPKLTKLVYRAMRTTYAFNLGSKSEPVKKIEGDEDTTNFLGTTWFNQVQVPNVVAPTALSVSASSPANAATGVAINAALTVTFNNALNNDAIYNAVLINSATGAIIAGTNTIDGTRKILTIGHTANLAAATAHRIVLAVKDIYGQNLSQVITFTTA